MNFFKLAWFLSIVPFIPLGASLPSPIRTEYAVFLFDHGEKNQIAAMLEYAEKHDQARLAALDFRLIFMGPATESMTQEPFCHYPDKLIHYKQLGIEETIDHTWRRERKIDVQSLLNLSKYLNVQKKAWCPVSCAIFGQILEMLQKNGLLEVFALRDNPNETGDTDYFKIAQNVQELATKLIVPSQDVAETISQDKQVVIVGHAPTELWQQQAEALDKQAVLDRLGLHLHDPIIVYTGGYGQEYEKAFKQFLDLIQDQVFAASSVQIVIAPHPRYQGIVEKKIYEDLDEKIKRKILIVGEFGAENVQKARTVEVLSIADVVVTADSTSTIVLQANALRKKVLYIHPHSSSVSEKLCSRNILQRVSHANELLQIAWQAHELSAATMSVQLDIFQMLGIPRHGARLLWEAFIHPEQNNQS